MEQDVVHGPWGRVMAGRCELYLRCKDCRVSGEEGVGVGCE